MHVMDCSCASILRFFYGVRWRHGKPPNSGPHFLSVWGRIASPIMHEFGRCFPHLLEDWMCVTTVQRTKRLVVPPVGGATKFANLRPKFSKTQKNRPELWQILRMVTIEIVINSNRVGVRVTILPLLHHHHKYDVRDALAEYASLCKCHKLICVPWEPTSAIRTKQ